jgi:hypothetical protein
MYRTRLAIKVHQFLPKSEDILIVGPVPPADYRFERDVPRRAVESLHEEVRGELARDAPVPEEGAQRIVDKDVVDLDVSEHKKGKLRL